MQKKKKRSAVLGLSASFYALNQTSRFFLGLALPILFLVLTCGKHSSKKNNNHKLESQKEYCPALRTGGFEGRNCRKFSKLVVQWRLGQLAAPHTEGKAKEYREKFHTIEKKIVKLDLHLARSKLCFSARVLLLTSALAPSLIL